MGKLIKITPELRQEILPEFEQFLLNLRCKGGKVSFEKTLPSVADRKATVYLTTIAFAKIWTLVSNFDKEIAWHGVAHRMEEPDSYLISDIMVYPQEVTGGTVNTDQVEYQNWLMEFDEEIYNNIRFQGHSHVEMGVSPSCTDLDHQKRIVDQLCDGDFYIFMIWNKKCAIHTKVYDLQANVFFDDSDCSVRILEDGFSFDEFLKDARKMVRNKTYAGGNGYNYYGGWNGSGSGYGSGNAGGYQSASKPAESPQTAPQKPSEPEKKAEETKPSVSAPKPRVPIAAGNYCLDGYDGPMDFVD